MKAYIKTYGCQMNEQDSLQMKGLLHRLGFGATEDPLEADLILINSCSIREKAVQKIYSDLGRVRPLAENNPALIVGLAGCVAQQEKENLTKRFPFLDLVFGPDAIRHLPQMIEEVQHRRRESSTHHSLVQTRFDARQDFAFVNLLPHDSENRVKAFVNIQKGCDNVCAFCIVPRVRGPEVSRPNSDIVQEVSALVSLGVKEVTLLGQNVNSYGMKNSDEVSFATLLHRVAKTGIQRLRYTTSHPKDVDDDLIEAHRSIPALCPHLHLPVQSGSNRILEAMRRQYTREHYLSLIERLKEARPGISFSTDIIVGFPGETEQDFKDTLDLVKQVDYDLSYTFIYSPRPGTTALRLDDGVSREEKEERLERLLELQREVARKRNQPLEGTTQEVLVEAFDDAVAQYNGRTPTNKIVHFSTQPKETFEESGRFVGQTVSVFIDKANPFSLMGTLKKV